MRHGQRAHLAPDGADLVGLTTVETDTLVEDAAPHGITHHIVVVAVHHVVFLLQAILVEVGVCSGIRLFEISQDLIESLGTSVFFQCLLGDVVGRLVEFLVHLLAQFLVVHLMVVLAFDILAEFFRQFGLQFAHGFDGIHSHLECTEQILLAHLFHLTFHHHDVVGGGAHHHVDVGLFHLLKGRIDHIFAVDTSHAHLGDGALEGNVGASQGS